MRRAITVPALAAVITLLAASATGAWACGGPKGHGAGSGGHGFAGHGCDGSHFERMAERLELTDEQKAAVEKIHDDGRGEMVALQKELAQARLELKSVMLDDDPSLSEVRKLVEQIGDLETRAHMTKIEHMLAFRKTLTPEQRDLFLLHGPHHGGGHGGGRDRGHGGCGDKAHHGGGARGHGQGWH